MRPPIADPFAPPLPDLETRVFKHKFWSVYFGTALLTLLIFVPLVAFWPLMREVFLGRGQGFVLFYVMLVNPLVSAWSITYLHPTRVNRLGIQGPPAVGLVEWEQMKSVRAIWFGMFYARVPARNHFFTLWIPLTFVDKRAFAQTIEEWAPEGNPLGLWVQKRGF